MGARYRALQVLAAVGVCTGCAMFTLADATSAGGRPASATGVFLLITAVCGDACTANTQETLITRYRIPTARMVRSPLALCCCPRSLAPCCHPLPCCRFSTATH